MGYDIAYQLFKLMQVNNEIQIPNDWIGALNVTYSFGGRLTQNRTITLNVYNQRKVAKIYNVLGVIKGRTEPDRYIIIGNHRDAWSYGGVDPNSGTAAMLEISRVLMNMTMHKWVPKRSIIFLRFISYLK